MKQCIFSFTFLLMFLKMGFKQLFFKKCCIQGGILATTHKFWYILLHYQYVKGSAFHRVGGAHYILKIQIKQIVFAWLWRQHLKLKYGLVQVSRDRHVIDVHCIYKSRAVYPFSVGKIKPQYLTAAHKFGYFKVRKSNWCDLLHLLFLVTVIKRNHMIPAVLLSSLGVVDKCANSNNKKRPQNLVSQISNHVQLRTVTLDTY